MTVPLQTIFTASTANGVTTVFPYSFKITDEEDLAVTVDGVLQTSGYTVSGVGSDTGGNVTFSVAPANGLSVVRYLAPILKREEDYQQFGDWLADVVNRDFDRLWLALQAKNQDTSRSIKLPVDTADDQTIEEDAATRAGKFISFDSYGNVTLSVLADLTTLSAVSAFMETLLDDANATAARSTLGAAAIGANTFTGTQTLGAGADIVFEGATDDGFETTITVTDPTADRTITIPDKSGTMAVTSDIAAAVPSPTGNEGLIIRSVSGAAAYRNAVELDTPYSTPGATYKDYAIPSWAREITVHFSGFGFNAGSQCITQLADSGGVEATGYVCSSARIAGTIESAASFTDGFGFQVGTDTSPLYGELTLKLMDASTNTWSCTGSVSFSGSTRCAITSGIKSLSAALSSVRVTTQAGTATINAGKINVSYR